ncbi:MAG: hypothetical protein ACI9GK_001739 [Devosia sp.]|jgi:hypothetical protein|tara:strand:- start:23691 stop:24023 length:333 start_codon:yes stop_codon:yes gene_type:complete
MSGSAGTLQGAQLPAVCRVLFLTRRLAMTHVTYDVVEHDGGYAYKVGDVFSETFPTHDAAHKAAESAAHRQQLGGETEAIQYQGANGKWHEELAQGGDRPETDVEDRLDD